MANGRAVAARTPGSLQSSPPFLVSIWDDFSDLGRSAGETRGGRGEAGCRVPEVVSRAGFGGPGLSRVVLPSAYATPRESASRNIPHSPGSSRIKTFDHAEQPRRPRPILHGIVHRQEALRMFNRLESSHLAFALPRRLMRDLRSVVLVLLRAVDHGRHHRAVRCRVSCAACR